MGNQSHTLLLHNSQTINPYTEHLMIKKILYSFTLTMIIMPILFWTLLSIRGLAAGRQDLPLYNKIQVNPGAALTMQYEINPENPAILQEISLSIHRLSAGGQVNQLIVSINSGEEKITCIESMRWNWVCDCSQENIQISDLDMIEVLAQ
jgi:hypothetical protein